MNLPQVADSLFTTDSLAGDTPPAEWDDWCREQTSEVGFCQTSTWANINSAANAVDNHWIEVHHNGQRVAGALLSLRRPDLHAMSATQRAKTIISGDTAGWLSCFQGPVLSGPDKPRMLALIIEQTDRLAAQTGAQGVRFHGPPAGSEWADDQTVLDVFCAYKYEHSPFLTSLVDLTAAENEIFASCKRAARKGIRKCEESGVQIFQCQSRAAFLEDFCTPYYDDVDTSPDPSRNLATWDIDGGSHYRFFVAKDAQGRVLATLGSYSFNGLATEVMSHRTQASFDENLPAQDLLHWHVFKAHKAAGDQLFNLAGYSSNPETEKAAGIRRFKEKWGGREVPVPMFTRDIPSLSKRAWRSLKSR